MVCRSLNPDKKHEYFSTERQIKQHGFSIHQEVQTRYVAFKRWATQEAVTEMVPNLIWAPDYFGPQEIWPQEVQ